jgi:hypothetical protein
MIALLPKEFILSAIRHGLTLGAGYLVSKGLTDGSSADALVGGIMGTVAYAWSYWTHTP